jgi:hypothetical protein
MKAWQLELGKPRPEMSCRLHLLLLTNNNVKLKIFFAYYLRYCFWLRCWIFNLNNNKASMAKFYPCQHTVFPLLSALGGRGRGEG